MCTTTLCVYIITAFCFCENALCEKSPSDKSANQKYIDECLKESRKYLKMALDDDAKRGDVEAREIIAKIENIESAKEIDECLQKSREYFRMAMDDAAKMEDTEARGMIDKLDKMEFSKETLEVGTVIAGKTSVENDNNLSEGNLVRKKEEGSGSVPEPLNRGKTEQAKQQPPVDNDKGWDPENLMDTIIGTAGDFALKIKDATTLGFDVEERFDDNIFGTWDIEKEHDFITRLSPRVEFSFDRNFFGRGNKKLSGETEKTTVTLPEVDLSLSFDVDYYVLHPKENTSGDFDSFFQPHLSFEIRPDEDLRFFYERDVARVNITQIDPLGDNQKQEKVNTTTTRYGFDYTIGSKRTPVELAYDHTSQENKGEDQFDNITDTWSILVNGNEPPSYLPRIFVEYDGERSNQGNDNQKKVTHDFFVGLNGKFSPKITGTAKAGYGFAFSNTGSIFDFKDPFSSFVTDVDLTYKVAPRVSLDANFNRSLGNVTSFLIDQGNAEEGEDTGAGLNISRQTRDEWEAKLGLEYTPPFFSENLTLSAEISHQEIEYSDGSKQKIQEIGFIYKYDWKNKNRTLGGKNGIGQAPGRNRKNRTKNYVRLGSEWSFEGELRNRKTSPEEGWSRFTNNEVSIKLTTEF